MQAAFTSDHAITIVHHPLTEQARKLNSTIGKYARYCQFSNKLRGRFYEDGSLEADNAKKRRIVRLKAEHKKLKRALELEDTAQKKLEEFLCEKARQRKKIMALRSLLEQKATMIQSVVRMYFARKKVNLLRVENAIIEYVALICQSYYRGWKGRRRARNLRKRMLRRNIKVIASIKVQNAVRCFLARKILRNLKRKQKMLNNFHSCMIQTCVRGWLARRRFLKEKPMKHKAAILIQTAFRGMLGARVASTMRFESHPQRTSILSEQCNSTKNTRVPMHERRYSTYGIMKRSRQSDREPSLEGLEIVNYEHFSFQSETSSLSFSINPEQDEKIKLARLKAAERVTEKIRQKRMQEATTLQTNKAVEERKADLELTRKRIMFQTASKMMKKSFIPNGDVISRPGTTDCNDDLVEKPAGVLSNVPSFNRENDSFFGSRGSTRLKGAEKRRRAEMKTPVSVRATTEKCGKEMLVQSSKANTEKHPLTEEIVESIIPFEKIADIGFNLENLSLSCSNRDGEEKPDALTDDEVGIISVPFFINTLFEDDFPEAEDDLD